MEAIIKAIATLDGMTQRKVPHSNIYIFFTYSHLKFQGFVLGCVLIAEEM